LIINTKPYDAKEIKEILKIRAKYEKIKLDEEALEYLTELGTKTSLRYVIQLLAPSSEMQSMKGQKKLPKSM
jgi:TBP-interacting protein